MQKNQKLLTNSYFSNYTDFSKSLGSSLYKPTSDAIISENKFAAFKNSLLTNNTHSKKNNDSNHTKYVASKKMK